ncbi:hypothetical protein DLAC_06175 [Tieghemostelium lacteum]|uniref:Transmembrane protein n=1 Tax=Tieghemostelium lacteum TaxID=361077 RepID=A0A151ZHM6_TIELA|nr:hypothetical protein DLAC_06175 [Tieghemostelium lacteum]|eukprot:KYQ93482.1 hypothetical protein DLAC_06175 [Tieghemostelium lacteum]
MRRQTYSSKPDLDNLDENEQTQVINELLKKDKSTNNLYLKVMCLIGLVCGVIKLVCAMLPMEFIPFEHSAHDVMRANYVSGFVIAWLEWMSASSYLAGAIALYPDFVKGFIRKWMMIVCSLFTFVGALVVLLISGSLFACAWFLGLNSVYLVACIYILSLTTNSQYEIMSLQKFTYSHKKV